MLRDLVLGEKVQTGDPRRHDDPKVDRLRRTVQRLLTERRPFLAVCLSHQVVSDLLGLPLQRLPAPNQGVQRQIDLFGHRVRVGFYNTFSAHCGSDIVATAGPAGAVEVARDAGTGEVYALRGNAFRSVQFHAESILSEDGVHIIRDLLTELLALPHQPHDTTQGRDHDGARVAADR